MNRPAIIPIVATTVVMVGAASVVANPPESPRPDIRISASDVNADGTRLDVLDPGFLGSIGAAQSPTGGVLRIDWPFRKLQRVLAFGIDGGAPPAGNSVIDGLMQATADNPLLFIGVLAFASPNGALELLPGQDDALSPADLLRTLSSLSTGFGEVGANFVEAAGMTPAVINELAKQVSAGTMTPENALRRLIAVPLSATVGHASITGNPAIDGVFKNGLLQTIINVVVKNTPPALGGGESGAIDRMATAVTSAVTDMRDAIDPSARDTVEDATAQSTGATTDSTAAVTVDQAPKENTTGTKQTTATGDSGGTSTNSPRPSRTAEDVAKTIRERIKQTLTDLSRRNSGAAPGATRTPVPGEPGSAAGIGTPSAGSPRTGEAGSATGSGLGN